MTCFRTCCMSEQLIEQYKQKQFVKSGESKNPDEIQLNDDDDEETNEGGTRVIGTKMIPSQVFGSLKANGDDEEQINLKLKIETTTKNYGFRSRNY